MLKAEMNVEDLRSWAEENHVKECLSFPVRILKPTDVDKHTWLWLYHHGNLSIEQVICRNTAHENQKPDEWNIPHQYQYAAIEKLIQLHQNILVALEEEKEIDKLQCVDFPGIQKALDKFKRTRNLLRQEHYPRTRRERITGRVWFERNSCELVYKEEVQSWCGDGRWPEFRLKLQTGEVYCKCKKGKLGNCRIAISAVDRACEWLIQPNPIHKNIEELISTPTWAISLSKIQNIIKKRPFSEQQLQIGWKINKRAPFYIQPIQIQDDASISQIEITDLNTHSFYIQNDTDKEIISTLGLINGDLQLSKKQKQSFMYEIMQKLINHNFVYCGKKKVSIKKGIFSISLDYESSPTPQYFFTIYFNKKQVSPIDVYNDIQQNSIQNILINYGYQNVKSESSKKSQMNETLYITKISSDIKVFLQVFTQYELRFPEDSLPLLFDICTQLQVSIPIDINIDIDIKNVSPKPKIHLKRRKDKLDVHLEIWIENFASYELSKGPENVIAKTRMNYFVKYQRDIKKEVEFLKYLTPPKEIREDSDIDGFLKRCIDFNIDIVWPRNYQKLDVTDFHLQIKQSYDCHILDGQLMLHDETIFLFDVLKRIRRREFRIFTPDGIFEFNTKLQQILMKLADRVIPIKKTSDPSIQDYELRLDKAYLNINKDIKNENPFTVTGDFLEVALKQTSEPPNVKTKVPTSFLGTLRPYQSIGFSWIEKMSKQTMGVCLGDEMGLGKTVQTLAYISKKKGNHLIVAPMSLLHNWNEEGLRFIENLQVSIFHGPNRKCPEIDRSKNAIHIIITTYGTLTRELLPTSLEKNDSEALNESTTFKDFIVNSKFDTIVFDEVQYLKNPDTRRYKCAKLCQSDFYIAISGTPIENNIRDIWSIFSIINPNLLGSYPLFENRFGNAIQSGDQVRTRALSQLLQPFLLRRYKIDVAQDLPEKNEIDISIPLSIDQRTIYEETYKKLYSELEDVTSDASINNKRIKILSLITKLRQIVCHPRLVFPQYIGSSSKLERIIEVIDELQTTNKKILVFSQFVSFLQIVIQRLKEKYTYSYLDGKSTTRQRKIAVDEFQRGKSDIFFLSIKAGGVGLNLTQASEVLILDPWWNPAIEQQATDRAHRIGQKEPVTVYRFVAQNTIEGKIREMHKRKKHIAHQILNVSDDTLSFESLISILQDN